MSEKMEFSVLPVKALRLALRLGWKRGHTARTAATQVQRCPTGISTAPAHDAGMGRDAIGHV